MRERLTIRANNDLFFTRQLLGADIRRAGHLHCQGRHFFANTPKFFQVIAKNAGHQLRLDAGQQFIRTQLDRLRNIIGQPGYSFVHRFCDLALEILIANTISPFIQRFQYHHGRHNINRFRITTDFGPPNTGIATVNLREITEHFLNSFAIADRGVQACARR